MYIAIQNLNIYMSSCELRAMAKSMLCPYPATHTMQLPSGLRIIFSTYDPSRDDTSIIYADIESEIEGNGKRSPAIILHPPVKHLSDAVSRMATEEAVWNQDQQLPVELQITAYAPCHIVYLQWLEKNVMRISIFGSAGYRNRNQETSK